MFANFLRKMLPVGIGLAVVAWIAAGMFLKGRNFEISQFTTLRYQIQAAGSVDAFEVLLGNYHDAVSKTKLVSVENKYAVGELRLKVLGVQEFLRNNNEGSPRKHDVEELVLSSLKGEFLDTTLHFFLPYQLSDVVWHMGSVVALGYVLAAYLHRVLRRRQNKEETQKSHPSRACS